MENATVKATMKAHFGQAPSMVRRFGGLLVNGYAVIISYGIYGLILNVYRIVIGNDKELVSYEQHKVN